MLANNLIDGPNIEKIYTFTWHVHRYRLISSGYSKKVVYMYTGISVLLSSCRIKFSCCLLLLLFYDSRFPTVACITASTADHETLVIDIHNTSYHLCHSSIWTTLHLLCEISWTSTPLTRDRWLMLLWRLFAWASSAPPLHCI